MADWRSQPDSVSLFTSDRRLGVEFHWQLDRFVHRLFLDGVEAGHSIEGDADQAWPPSPPIQQLSLESINGESVILGVGAAGQGHWSMSVEADSETLKFELACRSKQDPMRLISTYSLSESLALTAVEDSAVGDHGAWVTASPVTLAGVLTRRWAYQLSRQSGDA